MKGKDSIQATSTSGMTRTNPVTSLRPFMLFTCVSSMVPVWNKAPFLPLFWRETDTGFAVRHQCWLNMKQIGNMSGWYASHLQSIDEISLSALNKVYMIHGGTSYSLMSPSIASYKAGIVYADPKSHQSLLWWKNSTEVEVFAGSGSEWSCWLNTKQIGNMSGWYASRLQSIDEISLSALNKVYMIHGGTSYSLMSPSIASYKAGIVYADPKSHQSLLWWKNSTEVEVFAGSGSEGNNDGMASRTEFYQPTGLCVEFNCVVYVCDVQTNCTKILTSLKQTATFLNAVGKIYKAFSVHEEHQPPASKRQSSLLVVLFGSCIAMTTQSEMRWPIYQEPSTVLRVMWHQRLLNLSKC